MVNLIISYNLVHKTEFDRLCKKAEEHQNETMEADSKANLTVCSDKGNRVEPALWGWGFWGVNTNTGFHPGANESQLPLLTRGLTRGREL